MSKCKDLSLTKANCDVSIIRTAALLGCSRSAVVNFYHKWTKEESWMIMMIPSTSGKRIRIFGSARMDSIPDRFIPQL